MVRRYSPLNERQLEVLRWIDRGSPDGVWGDYSYKRTTYALADRGLVTVDKRRGAWSALPTDAGRHYLEHGTYKAIETSAGPQAPNDASSRTRPPTERSSEPPVLSPEDLLLELRAAGAALTVSAPSSDTRRAYRSAINRALTAGLVPDGQVLRHTGRDKGDLVIRLVDMADTPSTPEALPPIPIPASLDDPHNVVRRLRDSPDALNVSSELRQRALLLVQAVAEECATRGWSLVPSEDGQHTFSVSVGDDTFALTLSEETERREVPDDDQLATAKYAWQRVPSHLRKVPSGRLSIQLGKGYGSLSWADRKRWTLDDKLPAVFKEVEERAAAQVGARMAAAAKRQARIKEWEDAVPLAREAYLHELNRRRLSLQIESRHPRRRQFVPTVIASKRGLSTLKVSTTHKRRWASGSPGHGTRPIASTLSHTPTR